MRLAPCIDNEIRCSRAQLKVGLSSTAHASSAKQPYTQPLSRTAATLVVLLCGVRMALVALLWCAHTLGISLHPCMSSTN